ncbi:MAG: hypothetical protein WC128_05580, partial [Bacteroidales bacterium]
HCHPKTGKLFLLAEASLSCCSLESSLPPHDREAFLLAEASLILWCQRPPARSSSCHQIDHTRSGYCHCKPPGASAKNKSSRWFAVAVTSESPDSL